MRRITVWAMSTLSTLVLLFSYHTSTSSDAATASGIVATDTNTGTTPTPTPTPTPSTAPSTSSATPTPSETSASPEASQTPTAQAAAAGTFTGQAINTRYGPVQVQITVESGKITKSVVTQVPWTDRKDQEINSQAVPILNSEAVAAQSANIDMVSGATYTSEAYLQSLQSAIDQAHL